MERLLCLEEVDCLSAAPPKRAFRHKTLLNDRRVLRNLLAKEDAYMPSGNYFVFQEEIRPYMRTVLTKWMMDVRRDRYRCFPGCFCYHYFMMNKIFSSQKYLNLESYQLVTCCD